MVVVEVMVVAEVRVSGGRGGGDGGGGGGDGGRGDGHYTWCNWCEVNNPSNFLFQEFGGYFIINGNERLIRMLIVTRRNYVSQRDMNRTYTHTGLA